jgi:hypothetical protein
MTAEGEMTREALISSEGQMTPEGPNGEAAIKNRGAIFYD